LEEKKKNQTISGKKREIRMCRGAHTTSYGGGRRIARKKEIIERGGGRERKRPGGKRRKLDDIRKGEG